MARTLKIMYRFTILKHYRVMVMYKERNFSGGGGDLKAVGAVLRPLLPRARVSIRKLPRGPFSIYGGEETIHLSGPV